MDKVVLLLGLLLHRSVSVDSSMTPNWVRAHLFQLSLGLGQRVVIEGLENVFSGESNIALQNDLTNCSQS